MHTPFKQESSSLSCIVSSPTLSSKVRARVIQGREVLLPNFFKVVTEWFCEVVSRNLQESFPLHFWHRKCDSMVDRCCLGTNLDDNWRDDASIWVNYFFCQSHSSELRALNRLELVNQTVLGVRNVSVLFYEKVLPWVLELSLSVKTLTMYL